jgi:ribonuclease T2
VFLVTVSIALRYDALTMTRRLTAVALLFLTPFALSARSKHKKHANSAGGDVGAFDYYLLSMSWAPGFCAQPSGHHTDLECGKGRHVGFVVHGLWPQRSDGVRVENCGSASPVSSDIVNSMLPLMPDAGLIQHEWTTHGTCSGLPVADYFALIRKAYDTVHVPDALKAPDTEGHAAPSEIEGKFAQANSAGKQDFRVSCPANELREIRACLTKDAKLLDCPPDLQECRAPAIVIRPVQ